VRAEGFGYTCDRSRSAINGADLDDRARGEGMVEETARHCGHLDLLRESIDGQVGE
jgi:hypothetical protein